MIIEDYVSFETAKLLKEKGFDEYCPESYFKMDKTLKKSGFSEWEKVNEIKAPTQSLAMKWLREVHYIHIVALCPIVDVDSDWFGVTYNVVISNLKNHCLAFNTDIEDNEYDTYEQAVEEAIKYCLKHLI